MTSIPSDTRCAPVWFIAHGGPPTLFDVEHGAHQHWLKVISDIKASRLKGIVFVSAHWQAEHDDLDGQQSGPSSPESCVLINTNTSNPLVYDFYNFPSHYYDVQFRSSNPVSLQQAVLKQLSKEGYHVKTADRGLDHGVWVPLRAAGEHFDVPILQVSLPISVDPAYDGSAALRLGQALRELREEGYAIIGGGQPVHNLSDYRKSRQGHSTDMSYGETFPAALREALTVTGDSTATGDSKGDPVRWEKAKSLYSRQDYLRAHPTSEHLLPALVAFGASRESEAGVEQYKQNEGPLAWSMYRFG